MASVEAYETSTGRRYRVRYRTPERRQTDKRGFRTKREAEDFLATVEVSKLPCWIRRPPPRVWAKCGQSPDSQVRTGRRNAKSPGIPGLSMVAPTGVDPVTFRFSVERSTN